MTPDEYLRFDAIGLAGLIARKEVSARDVIAAAIARIETLNPTLNAVVATCLRRRWRRCRTSRPAASLSSACPI